MGRPGKAERKREILNMVLVPRHAFRGFLRGLGAAAIISCGGGGGSSSPTTPNNSTPVLTTVTVAAPAGSPASLVAGQTLQLIASPRDQSGNAASANVSWSSSATNVATVSSSGLVTAV